MKFAPFCFCTSVDHKALKGLLEATTGGTYKDNHPWAIAAEMLGQAQARDEVVVLMLATIAPFSGEESSREDAASNRGPDTWTFTHWSIITEIEVNRFRQGTESRVSFGKLTPVSELWSALDSLQLLPAAERLRREALEGLRPSRQCLDDHSLHPYAICELPPFVLAHRDDGDAAEADESLDVER